MSSYYKSGLRCAEHPSAHESGIFCLLFLLLKKSRSPHAVGTGVANASKATHVEQNQTLETSKA